VSAALYAVRVFFGAAGGCVRVPGLHRHLIAPPRIPGLPELQKIDFAPSTATYLITASTSEKEIHMDETQIALVHAWLAQIAGGAA
jgi:hypothetical protein